MILTPRAEAIRAKLRENRIAKHNAILPIAKQLLDIVDGSYETRLSEVRRLAVIEYRINVEEIRHPELLELFTMYTLTTARKHLRYIVEAGLQ